MDSFYFEEEVLCWDSFPEPQPQPQPPLGIFFSAAPLPLISAFTAYSRSSALEQSSTGGNNINIHRRAIGLLKKISKAESDNNNNNKEGGGDKGSTREFRHMMRERQRREKLSQSYADLYAIMSYRSKADKNSIVQSAAVYVRELKEIKEEMRRRNEELKARLKQRVRVVEEEEKVTIRVAKPASSSAAIDSMITALRCLKGADAKATSIRSDFSDHDVTAVVTIAMTKAKAAELERQVERELKEVEQKLRASFDTRSGWSHYCHVDN